MTKFDENDFINDFLNIENDSKLFELKFDDGTLIWPFIRYQLHLELLEKLKGISNPYIKTYNPLKLIFHPLRLMQYIYLAIVYNPFFQIWKRKKKTI